MLNVLLVSCIPCFLCGPCNSCCIIPLVYAPDSCPCRRELLPEYKAQRIKPSPEFSVDLTNLQLLLQFTRIPTLAVPGFEADDVGTYQPLPARQHSLAACTHAATSLPWHRWQFLNEGNSTTHQHSRSSCLLCQLPLRHVVLMSHLRLWRSASRSFT
jgi:hypothetical protein